MHAWLLMEHGTGGPRSPASPTECTSERPSAQGFVTCPNRHRITVRPQAMPPLTPPPLRRRCHGGMRNAVSCNAVMRSRHHQSSVRNAVVIKAGPSEQERAAHFAAGVIMASARPYPKLSSTRSSSPSPLPMGRSSRTSHRPSRQQYNPRLLHHKTCLVRLAPQQARAFQPVGSEGGSQRRGRAPRGAGWGIRRGRPRWGRAEGSSVATPHVPLQRVTSVRGGAQAPAAGAACSMAWHAACSGAERPGRYI